MMNNILLVLLGVMLGLAIGYTFYEVIRKLFDPLKYRVGRKQNRAILDSEGNEVVVFPKGKEDYAKRFCELLNRYGA